MANWSVCEALRPGSYWRLENNFLGGLYIFRKICQYENIYRLCLNVERVMEMFSKELRELDQNTVQLMIDEMQQELDSQRQAIDSQKQELDSKEETITAQADEIRKLRERLKQLETE